MHLFRGWLAEGDALPAENPGSMRSGPALTWFCAFLPASPNARLAELALARSGATPLVSGLVISEVYFALHYHDGVPKDEALALLARFLDESNVISMGAAVTVLAGPYLSTTKPGFVDRLVHAEYARSAGDVLTFEKAVGCLPGVRVLIAP